MLGGRQYARVRLHPSHRIWGQICSQRVLLCTAVQGNNYGLTEDQRGTHRETERGRRRVGRDRNAALFMKQVHIFLDICLRSGTRRVIRAPREKGEISHHSRAARAGCFGMSGYCSASAERWTRHIGAKELATCHVTEERCFATAAGCSRRQMPSLASFLACIM